MRDDFGDPSTIPRWPRCSAPCARAAATTSTATCTDGPYQPPKRGHSSVTTPPLEHMVAVMLRSGGAGVVGQDAEGAPIGRSGAGRPRPRGRRCHVPDWPIHDQIGDRLAVDVADQPIALIDHLFRRAAVARHRHPAGIDQDPALFRLVTDDRGQHRHRDVVDLADADAGHDQIEEDEHPGPHLGDPSSASRHERRRRADADHRAGVTGRAQDPAAPTTARPLPLGRSRQGRRRRARHSSRRHGSARRAAPPPARAPRPSPAAGRRRRASRRSGGRRSRSRSAPRAAAPGSRPRRPRSACATLSSSTARSTPAAAAPARGRACRARCRPRRSCPSRPRRRRPPPPSASRPSPDPPASSSAAAPPRPTSRS